MANQYKQMSEEESLKKSHSKWSNFKLTLMCILATIALTGLVVFLAFIPNASADGWIGIAITGMIVCALGCALSLFLFSRFKR